MRPPVRPFRLFLALAFVAPAALWLGNGCAQNTTVWVCFDPGTGHDGTYYDATNFNDGMPDPCHCYDTCGPKNTCPIIVDAGPPPPGCPMDGGADGADGGP